MSLRFLGVLLLAAVCGTSAAVGMSRMKGSGDGPIPMVPVVVARTDIVRGCTLTADMLELRDWPEKLAPRNAINKLDDAVDCAVLMQIVAGDLVLTSKLADKNAGRGLAPLIPEGMRAYTIQTSRIASTVA